MNYIVECSLVCQLEYLFLKLECNNTRNMESSIGISETWSWKSSCTATLLLPTTSCMTMHTHVHNLHPEMIMNSMTDMTIKGAWSEIFGKLIFFKLADMATFPTNISSTVKKLQICISFASNLRKQCLCYLLFYKWWKPRLLISKQVFH